MHHVLIKILVLVHKLQDAIWTAIIHVNLCNVIKPSLNHLIQQLIMWIANIFNYVSIKLLVKMQLVMDRIPQIVIILEDVSIISI